MDKFVDELLDNMDQGITIIDSNLDIIVWNRYMENITQVKRASVIKTNIYEVIPSLNKNYFKNAIQSVLKNGAAMFFSAAMHKGLLNSKDNLNLKISRLSKGDSKSLLLEFINVSNKIAQISQLKDYVNQLYLVNKELKEKQKIIKKLAYYDNLTGVANRNLFYKVANRYLKDAKEQNNELSLLFIDIDNFKDINDQFGHLFGDKLLVKVANILQNAIGSEDLVSRYGGDEFLVLLKSADKGSYHKQVITKINSEDRILSSGDKNVSISLSIGVSRFPLDGDTIDQLMAKADQEMYLTKKSEE